MKNKIKSQTRTRRHGVDCFLSSGVKSRDESEFDSFHRELARQGKKNSKINQKKSRVNRCSFFFVNVSFRLECLVKCKAVVIRQLGNELQIDED